ncbi:MAG: hypothetical protein J0H46_01160 [Bacteroidetes bacterium]|nr:hypothetical protein [Bacteroidota bacterium]
MDGSVIPNLDNVDDSFLSNPMVGGALLSFTWQVAHRPFRRIPQSRQHIVYLVSVPLRTDTRFYMYG